MRAQAMGFVAKRANRAYVYHLGCLATRNEMGDYRESEANPNRHFFPE